MTEEEKRQLEQNPEEGEPLTEEQQPPVPDGDTQAPEGEMDKAPVEPEQQQEQLPETEPEPEPEPQPRMFSQEEVNAIVGKARQEARQRARDEYAAELRERFGVENDSEIDDMVGNGQRFEALNGEYETLNGTVEGLKAENALLKSGIPESKFDDVKAILAYKHLEVTPENIAVEAATHPEWSMEVGAPEEGAPTPMPQPPQPPQAIPPQRQMPQRPNPSVVQKLGGEPQANAGPDSEEQKAAIMKLFGR